MAVQSKSEPVLDIEGTLVRFGGDKELFVEMSGIVLEDAPRILSKLREAVEQNDAAAIRAQAHALKGLLAGCGGVRAANAAQQLEDAGNSGKLADCSAMIQSLEMEFTLLTRALSSYQP